MDPKARAALDAATWRLVLSLSHVRRLEQSLSNDATAQAAIGDVDLAAFIPKRNYAPSALAPHFSLEFAGSAICGAPVAGDDGRRAGRPIARRRPARQLGSAHDRRGDASGIRPHPAAARRPRHRHADRVRAGGGLSRLFAGRRAGRGPGLRGRRDPQLCAAQLPHLLDRRLGDGAGDAASGPAMGLGADPGAPRRYAGWRGDRASLQLFLAALGVSRGAAIGEPPSGSACRVRRRRAEERRQRT